VNCVGRLGLGTVQWGMDYGIANVSGRPSPPEVARMLDRATVAGVSLLDTAATYGQAECVLGEALASQRFSIVTKTSAGSSCEPSVDAMRDVFVRSLRRLGCESVYGLLVHDVAHLLDGEFSRALWRMLLALKDEGQVEKIGVSVYTPEQLTQVLEAFPIDVVQLPYSVYDRRFEVSGALDRLLRAGVEVHVRSAFLQGLLLMQADVLSDHFASISAHHARFVAHCDDAGWTQAQAALGFCLSHPCIDRVIVGCESYAQLEPILRASEHVCDELRGTLAGFSIDDESIILPTNWPKR
jgi:aryl-alcohol dehydrogenase-like predicted oxidoreductase